MTPILNIHRDMNDILWIYNEKLDTYGKHTQYIQDRFQSAIKHSKIESVQNEIILPNPIQEAPKIEVPQKQEEVYEIHEKQQRKVKKQTPFDVIFRLSDNNVVNIDYIKNTMQTFISAKEFQKVFGIKKTSEIMKGLTENKWNKSLVIFLSFIFNASFVYLGKDVIFDSNNPTKYSELKIII